MIHEPPHDKTNKMTSAPSEDSDQPGHPPSLISIFTVHSMGSWGSNLSSCGQRRLWSDWADAQADLSLRWVHNHFVGFVMRRLTCWPALVVFLKLLETSVAKQWIEVNIQINFLTGTIKARVLPDPVFAAPSMSCPCRARPMDSLWISVGTLYLCDFNPATNNNIKIVYSSHNKFTQKLLRTYEPRQ